VKFKYETHKEKVTRLEKWHNWFAWYPVFESGDCYWLEVIERRYVFPFTTPFGEYHYKEFREIINSK
jgi:hypothetical protein